MHNLYRIYFILIMCFPWIVYAWNVSINHLIPVIENILFNRLYVIWVDFHTKRCKPNQNIHVESKVLLICCCLIVFNLMSKPNNFAYDITISVGFLVAIYFGGSPLLDIVHIHHIFAVLQHIMFDISFPSYYHNTDFCFKYLIVLHFRSVYYTWFHFLDDLCLHHKINNSFLFTAIHK